jgi:Spondin_N
MKINVLGFLLLVVLAKFTLADIVVNNELIKPAELYDTVTELDSKVFWQTPNVTKYYCIFRGTWDKKSHPQAYPKLARWSNQLIYSGTKQFLPWMKDRATTWGVEKIAEVGPFFHYSCCEICRFHFNLTHLMLLYTDWFH